MQHTGRIHTRTSASYRVSACLFNEAVHQIKKLLRGSSTYGSRYNHRCHTTAITMPAINMTGRATSIPTQVSTSPSCLRSQLLIGDTIAIRKPMASPICHGLIFFDLSGCDDLPVMLLFLSHRISRARNIPGMHHLKRLTIQRTGQHPQAEDHINNERMERVSRQFADTLINNRLRLTAVPNQLCRRVILLFESEYFDGISFAEATLL